MKTSLNGILCFPLAHLTQSQWHWVRHNWNCNISLCSITCSLLNAIDFQLSWSVSPNPDTSPQKLRRCGMVFFQQSPRWKRSFLFPWPLFNPQFNHPVLHQAHMFPCPPFAANSPVEALYVALHVFQLQLQPNFGFPYSTPLLKYWPSSSTWSDGISDQCNLLTICWMISRNAV